MANKTRRQILKGLLASGATLTLTGCDKLSRSEWFTGMLGSSEKLTHFAQDLVTPRKAMAREFTQADISPEHRPNGSTNPDTAEYKQLAANNFADYKLKVGGLVKNPVRLSLDDLRALPSRTQITRHDCVEGWSAIGEWTGAKLSALLDHVQPLPSARYLVFRCADFYGSSGDKYYETIDMDDAYHPQTLLAYGLNGELLPVANGAPLRLRVERQLGYKMAKYIMAIELVENFEDIGGGHGGFWEDRGYAWYAGI